MPIYEYRCENGHTFELMRRVTDPDVTECEVCGAPVRRVFHPIAVHFKGSGFYNTDYGTKRRAREKAAHASRASEGSNGSEGSTNGSSKAGSADGSGSSSSSPDSSGASKPSSASAHGAKTSTKR